MNIMKTDLKMVQKKDYYLTMKNNECICGLSISKRNKIIEYFLIEFLKIHFPNDMCTVSIFQ